MYADAMPSYQRLSPEHSWKLQVLVWPGLGDKGIVVTKGPHEDPGELCALFLLSVSCMLKCFVWQWPFHKHKMARMKDGSWKAAVDVGTDGMQIPGAWWLSHHHPVSTSRFPNQKNKRLEIRGIDSWGFRFVCGQMIANWPCVMGSSIGLEGEPSQATGEYLFSLWRGWWGGLKDGRNQGHTVVYEERAKWQRIS